jgi:hypothetical protein
MALTDYKPQFDNAYQEVFQKVLVAKAIANLRFEKTLTYGESVERVAYDISGVRVRTVVRNAASTIDAVTDTSETLLINIEKEAVFEISDGEVKQAGPLNPGAEIGGKVAQKVAEDFDARIFAEVANAYQTFDNGDLTTLASDLTPITLSSTTVPQMVTRMPAKLRYGAKQTLTNLAMVIDSYAAADIAQYLLGKQFDVVNAVFKNGYAEGQVAGAEVYISENLTGSAVLTASGVFVNTQTVIINGVTFTSVDSIGTTAGNFLVGTAAESLGYLAALINNPGTTSATQVALSAADQITIAETLKLAAIATATTLTIVGTGSGRLVVSETQTNCAWGKNHIKSFFGKKGAIDAVLQDMKEVDMRSCSDRRATNVFSSYLGGIKTFADGAKKMLQVKIAC